MLGATGLVGAHVVERLVATGHNVVAVSRHPPPTSSRFVMWHPADLTVSRDIDGLPDCEAAISTLAVWMTANVVQRLNGLRRLVAFSSTSAITKADAHDRGERRLAARLLGAEASLRSLEPSASVTILRPTMIYGSRGDRNVERIADQLRRFPVFPLVGDGRGLRQPVHAQDLGTAAVAALDGLPTGRSYTLAGAEVLTVRELVARVGESQGIKVRFLSVPLPLARLGLRAMGVLPGFRGVPAGALERMTQDLVFDNSTARAELEYAPRAFEPPTYDI